MKSRLHLCLGVAFWLAAAVWLVAASKRSPRFQETQSTLRTFWTTQPVTLEVSDPTGSAQRFDPVFWQDENGDWHQVGYVDEIHQRQGDATAAIDWHDQHVKPEQCRLTFHQRTGGLDEVLATLLPAEKRQRVQERLADVMEAHGEELTRRMLPLVERSLRRSLPVIETELRASVRRHRSEINELGDRWNDEVVLKRLVPLARREIMPIVERQGRPTAEAIGRELWDRASIWRFGWRAIYDRAPLPERNLVQAEWDRFVQEEASPVVEKRMNEIVKVVQRVVREVADNPRVRDELSDVADQVAADPKARKLVRTLLRESVIDNQRLREVWTEVWTSKEARQAIEVAGDRLEPVVRQIGDDLFGTEQMGIDPNFARVLRNQILGKDRRWIVAKIDPTDASLVLNRAASFSPYPMVYTANPPSILPETR